MGIIQSGKEPQIGMVLLQTVIQLTVGSLRLPGRKAAVSIINRIRMDNASLYPILLLILGIFIFAATYF